MVRYFLLSLLIVCLFSCRSAKQLAVPQVKETVNMTEGKLFRNVEENELDYSSLYSRKIDVSININEKKNNLKGVLKIQRDSFIWMSLTAPLGIEVARVFLTQDSVKFLDSYNKKFLVTDYKFFYDRFGVDLSFDCLQRILTNVYFDLESCSKNNPKGDKFKFERTDRDYVLSNVQKRALNRKLKKFFKKKRKNKDFALVLQKIHIDPEFYRPYKVTVEDLEEDMGVTAVYSDFKYYGDKVFPETLNVRLSFDSNDIHLELKFLRLEFDVSIVPNFRIPGKYKKLD